MNNQEWLDYNSETNDFLLHNFIREYDYNKPKEFNINYNNRGFFRCKLETSSCFKGLTYISALNVDTGEHENFAVGDDNVISWQPPYIENDLMVG